MGTQIYGCDDCLSVCWNKFARNSQDNGDRREDLTSPKVSELLQLDDATFRSYFRKSPIKRTGATAVRNVLIAAGNGSKNAGR